MMIEIPEFCTQLKSLVRKGRYQQALSLFQLHHKHYPVTHETLTHILPSLIKSSSSSSSSNHHLRVIPIQLLHSMSLKTCAISDIFVPNSLISVYSKRLGGLNSARRVFDEMPERDTVTWNSMIMGFIQNEMFHQALRFFTKMRVATEGLSPIKPEVIASVVSVCSKTGMLRQGKEIHGLVVTDGVFFAEEPSLILIETALVDLYVKCGELGMGFRVFDRMKVKNVVSWTAMIDGCTANGAYEMALDCVRNFMDDRIRPNRVTLISVMPACAQLGLINQGKEIHGFGLRHGFDGEPRFSAGLIAMYCSFKGGGRKGASSTTRIAGIILDRSHERDVVMWTTVLGNFAQNGGLDQAMKQLNTMRSEGIEANYVTLLALLSGCANQVSLTNGRAIHCHALKSSLCSDPYVGNALIDMYAKCGLAQDSSRTFADLPEKDPISWSALINAYGINGQGHRALAAFYEMKEEGMEVDGIALLSTLSACNHSGLVEQAQSIFKEAVEEVSGGKRKWLGVEHYACMIDLLGKAGMIEEAYGVMKSMPFNKPNAKIWSSLVSKCKEHGKLDIAEALIREKKKVVEMEESGSAANYASSSSVVYAERGEWVNAEEVRRVMRLRTRRGGFSKVEVQNG